MLIVPDLAALPLPPPLPLPPLDTLCRLLAATDDFAVSTVQAGRGGPFGASIHIYDGATGELTQVLDLRANAVLATGMASAHAEDQALTPDMIAALAQALEGRDPATTSVVMSSSGESCPACHTKEEIAARHLIARGLILPGRFFVTYGATYRDALEVADFNDEPYARDMEKPLGTGMIAVSSRALPELAPSLQAMFAHSAAPLAVIELPGGVYIAATDHRGQGDLMATPEMSAIRAASLHQKEKNSKTAFDLDAATLWTSTPEIGPLAYATAQWANVTQIVSVTGGPPSARLAAPESPETTNQALFKAVSQPYNQAGGAITILHVTPFENRAQKVWRDTQHVQYNGIQAVS